MRIARWSSLWLLLVAAAAVSAWTAGATKSAAPSSTPEVAQGVRDVLALEGDVEAGKRAFASCAVCHLPDGRGRADGTFPQLAGQHREVIVKQLVDIREGRRRNPVMLPFAEALLDAQEIADVATYIETLPVPPSEPSAPDADLADADLAEGRRLYQRDCQDCHGPGGGGDPSRFVPRIAGQHEAYLLRQVRAIAAGRRRNAHPGMERRISDYTDAQLQAVVDFAARLPHQRTGEADAKP